MGIVMLISLLFCILEYFYNKHSIIKKKREVLWQGKWKGWYYSLGEDALRQVRVRGAGQVGRPPRRWSSPLFTSLGHGEPRSESAFGFLSNQAWCLWLGEGSLQPLLSARHHLTDPALLQLLALRESGCCLTQPTDVWGL